MPGHVFDIARSGGCLSKVAKEGDMDAGGWSCGMVVGLIHDIQPFKNFAALWKRKRL